MVTTFLTPVLALVVWTLIMWVWMYATRIPAMQKARVDPETMKTSKDRESGSKLPGKVVAVADNYNHLHEQPTIFYALMFYTHLVNNDTHLALWAAWAYVVLRIIHSLIQATSGKVVLRFGVFTLSALCLIVLAGINVGGMFV